jgi:uncharacterized protein (TIGR03000 family)
MGGYYGSLSPYGVIVADAAAPATIIVNLPADAKLKVDGSLVSQQTTPQRYLQTPPIQPGQQFTYTLVAETTREGRPVSQTQTITVQPGQQLLVNFALSTTPVTSSR